MLVDSHGEVAWLPPDELPGPVLVTAVREGVRAHRSRIGSVIAVRGPGSYMGVRGGLAAALGAAQALGCPLGLVGALEVVAAGCDPGDVAVLALADAGRGGTFGQEMVPAGGNSPRPGWHARGPTGLLGRQFPWPAAWCAPPQAIGTPGEGRQLPSGTTVIDPVRDRQVSLARLVAAIPIAISGYDRVTADYPEPVGA